MCTLDSLSRKHFFRKLPTTIDYLNDLNANSSFSVHDFKIHNIIGADTAENQSTVFGDKWVRSFKGNQVVDHYAEKAIWNKMRDRGFVTLLGFDSCNSNVPKVIGRRPNADNVVNTFYCANYIHGGYRAAKQLRSKQRCLGGTMCHDWLI